ncbi:DMT family transporter [Desulfosoma caldarium]|uniref:Putative multidrug resistance efflux transporter n=1 Tax=Desulfosoma caldarium TaxID=610254 RepID=A0A3N1UL90_9BACT|nr:multidrug resistance efflux transporter family protein [Desulfosoma caldarium]ROQ90169.1 putative multidrug resistance efflux transporter [Desulfosoma caldarium]
MIRLVMWGLAASAFFSATFIVNRAMSLSGGHWVWSAVLRYFHMLWILTLWIIVRHGWTYLTEVLGVFRTHILFWITAGSIGFGVFYGALCFAADHAPGWVVAATWQITILATPVVLWAFKRPIPYVGVVFTGLIFVGILLVHAQQVEQPTQMRETLFGALAVVLAAFAYPTGNQMLNAARHGGFQRIPFVRHPHLRDAPTCVLLMTLGSLPFWILLWAVVSPAPPESSQWMQTAIVALSSGVVATSLFYKARNASHEPLAIAAVDATQAGEVVFSLVGEILLLHGVWPTLWGWTGLTLIVGGLVGYCLGNPQTGLGPRLFSRASPLGTKPRDLPDP